MPGEKTKSQDTAYAFCGVRRTWIAIRSKLATMFTFTSKEPRPPPYDGAGNTPATGRYYVVIVGKEVGIFTDG